MPPSITSPGNYTISQSSYQANNGYSAFIIQLNTSNDITKTDIYSTQRGGQMKVNINSVGPLLGKVSGTFEGTIQGQKYLSTVTETLSVTSGKFEAVRLQ